MKQYNAITLVDGTYDLKEVQEILLKLLDDKISFHQVKNFSSHEMKGLVDKGSDQRLKSLEKSREKLKEFLKSDDLKDKKIRLHSEVFIEVLDV